jgi:SAM-dependent methyltransferase
MPDPFGRAIREFHRGELDEPLRRIDGADREDHPIEALYFEPFDHRTNRDLVDHLDGPLLDAGCGVGRHALFFQERVETVALDVSEALVATARDRGVRDTRVGDMFALRGQFPRDRFRSALAVGTQLGLAGSLRGIASFLGDLAYVTSPEATAVVDAYDPTRAGCPDLLGYRADPMPGLASRVFHFEYGGAIGPELLFRLLAPDRLREAAVGTGWRLSSVRRDEDGPYYRTFLEKRDGT